MISGSPSIYYRDTNDGSNRLINSHLCHCFLKLNTLRSQKYVLGCQTEKLKPTNNQNSYSIDANTKANVKMSWRYLAKKLCSCFSSINMYIYLRIYRCLCTHWNKLKVKPNGDLYISENIHGNSVWKSLININNFIMHTIGLSPDSLILIDISMSNSFLSFIYGETKTKFNMHFLIWG